MSWEATYNPSDSVVPNVVTAWTQVDVPTHNPNTINNPDISQMGTDYQHITPVGNSKVVGNAIVPFSANDQTAWNSAQASALNTAQRSQAQADLVSTSDLGKLIRAVADIIVNQLNLHTTWEASLAAAVAAAASLSDLKTRVAAITPVPSVTLAQAKTAILNDIAAGTEGD